MAEVNKATKENINAVVARLVERYSQDEVPAEVPAVVVSHGSAVVATPEKDAPPTSSEVAQPPVAPKTTEDAVEQEKHKDESSKCDKAVVSHMSEDAGESSAVVVKSPSVTSTNVAVAAAEEPIIANVDKEWDIDEKVEVEMTEDNDYRDTIHPAKVAAPFDKTNQTYKCGLLAFDRRRRDSFDNWSAEYVHARRKGEPDKEWREGDAVHFRYRNRKVGGKLVDGKRAAKGIWVKGVVDVLKSKDVIYIKHIDWKGGYAITEVKREDIRSAYSK